MINETKLSYAFNYEDYEQWKSHLDTEGFVVISNILSPNECDHAVDLFCDHFRAQANDWDFSDRNWTRGASGMILDGEIQRSRFLWYLRTNPKILEVYRTLYNLKEASELVSAMDRGNAIRNKRNTKPEKTPNEDSHWLHIDYPVFDEFTDWRCYQSFVNVIDCQAPDSPSLRVIPRSHRGTPLFEHVLKDIRNTHGSMVRQGSRLAYFELSKAFNLSNGILLNEEIEEKYKLVRVLAPAGSLVVWQCGTIHDAYTDLFAQNESYGDLRRLTAYICMAPRTLIRDEEELKLRQKMWEEGMTSTHWPVRYVLEHGTYHGPKREEMGLAEYKEFPYEKEKLLEEFPMIKSLIPLC